MHCRPRLGQARGCLAARRRMGHRASSAMGRDGRPTSGAGLWFAVRSADRERCHEDAKNGLLTARPAGLVETPADVGSLRAPRGTNHKCGCASRFQPLPNVGIGSGDALESSRKYFPHEGPPCLGEGHTQTVLRRGRMGLEVYQTRANRGTRASCTRPASSFKRAAGRGQWGE